MLNSVPRIEANAKPQVGIRKEDKVSASTLPEDLRLARLMLLSENEGKFLAFEELATAFGDRYAMVRALDKLFYIGLVKSQRMKRGGEERKCYVIAKEGKSLIQAIIDHTVD